MPCSYPAAALMHALPRGVQEGPSSSEGCLLFHQGNGTCFKLASTFTRWADASPKGLWQCRLLCENPCSEKPLAEQTVLTAPPENECPFPDCLPERGSTQGSGCRLVTSASALFMEQHFSCILSHLGFILVIWWLRGAWG